MEMVTWLRRIHLPANHQSAVFLHLGVAFYVNPPQPSPRIMSVWAWFKSIPKAKQECPSKWNTLLRLVKARRDGGEEGHLSINVVFFDGPLYFIIFFFFSLYRHILFFNLVS